MKKEECSKHLNIIQETISFLNNDETMDEIKNKNEEIYKCLLDYFEKHYEKDEEFINKFKSKWGWEKWEKQNRKDEEKEGESESKSKSKEDVKWEENCGPEGDENINWEESKEWENLKISRVYIHEIKLKLKYLANLITIFDENKESFKSYKEDISDKLKSLYYSLEWCFQNNTDIVMQIKENK